MPDILPVAGLLGWFAILGVVALSWETIDDHMRAAAVILALGYLSIFAAQLPDVPHFGALLMQVGGSGLLFTSVYFSYRSWEGHADDTD